MNLATWKLGQMNLAIHGLGGTIKYTERGSLLDDAFPNQKMDFVLANPPFNQDPWGAASSRTMFVGSTACRLIRMRTMHGCSTSCPT